MPYKVIRSGDFKEVQVDEETHIFVPDELALCIECSLTEYRYAVNCQFWCKDDFRPDGCNGNFKLKD